MKNNFIFEMLPLIAFFAVYFFTKNIYGATLICIIASWLQLLLYQLRYRKISKQTWLSTLLITLFGGLTIALHNKTFIMLKPTMLYWILGVVCYIAAKAGKNPLQLMLHQQIQLDDRSWQQLNQLWIGFFLILGVLNLIIAYYCTEYTWVKFKVFGGMALMLLFVTITGLIIYFKTKGTSNGSK